MLVVDTSALIAFLRGSDRPVRALMRQLEQQKTPWFLPLVCLQEVLQGARDDDEWLRLHATLLGQRRLRVQDEQAAHIEAARIYFDCRRIGLTIRSTLDCLIAAQTLQVGGTLVHDDADFRLIATVRPLMLLDGG